MCSSLLQNRGYHHGPAVTPDNRRHFPDATFVTKRTVFPTGVARKSDLGIDIAARLTTSVQFAVAARIEAATRRVARAAGPHRLPGYHSSARPGGSSSWR